MAYNDGTIYASISGSGFTSSCLEGIPFKIGPRFMPPTKIILPPDIDLRTTSRSNALNTEYSFDVEEAVLKWSAEREKQKEERLELQRQATLRKSQESSSSESQADEDEPDTSETNQSQPLYENAGVLQPQLAPRPKPRQKQQPNAYANVTIPNSLIANISNDILQPTPIQSSSKETEQTAGVDQNVSSKTDLDLTWFEKQDDPFDNLELKTINDMEELASVLQHTNVVTQNDEQSGDKSNEPKGNVNNTKDADKDEEDDENMYENVNLVVIKNGLVTGNSAQNSDLLDLTKLPPVPPRRDLAGRSPPLPPIGQSMDVSSSSVNMHTGNIPPGLSQSTDCVNSVNTSSNLYNNPSTSSNSFQPTATSKSISHKAPIKKPPRTFKYSRHVESENDDNALNSESNSEQVHLPNNPITTSFSEGNFSVQFSKTKSNPTLTENTDESELTFDSNHFGEQMNSRPVPAPRKTYSPPPRPSSGQSWNRYSPLPPTPLPSYPPQPAMVALPVISPGAESYNKLSKEAQTSVDNLVGMGFPRDRVIRAVEKLGEDEKEIVEFLCLVDQLTEKGYSIQLAETALLMFRNSMNQASAFLELFTQFQELGFSGDKIKEALVNTNNDREKTLDILTA